MRADRTIPKTHFQDGNVLYAPIYTRDKARGDCLMRNLMRHLKYILYRGKLQYFSSKKITQDDILYFETGQLHANHFQVVATRRVFQAMKGRTGEVPIYKENETSYNTRKFMLQIGEQRTFIK